MAGRTDATILAPPPHTIAVTSGNRVLADMGEMSATLTHSTLNIRGGYLRENRDVVKRFLRAYSEAIHVIKTDRNKTIDIFAKRMRIDDPETVQSTYDYFAPRFSFPPRVNLEGIRDTLDFYAERNPDFKNHKPQEFIDHSLLDELEKEGFFKKFGQ
jgi:ABC-type nitrate/sulfonate/bicarbonate transport system substrate-binding protein